MPTTDPAEAFSADEFIRIPHVAIMDEHSAAETHGGGKDDVTADDLAEMAEGINARWRETGDASRIVLGHTPPGQTMYTKSTGVGWATNAVVDDFFDTGRKGLFVDFYIKKKHADAIEKYPRRSIEYWKKTKTVDPIALLDDETPERFLGIVKYEREYPASVLKMTTPNPIPKSPAMIDDPKAALTDAVAGQTAGNKSLESKVDLLADKINQMSEMFMQLLSMVEGGGEDEDDLLGKADEGEGDDEGEEPEEKPKAKPEKKPAKKDDDEEEEPEKFGADFASPGDSFTPDLEKKTKMSRDYDDRAALKEIKATILRENADLRAAYNRSRAEKAVQNLEEKHRIDFGGEEGREEETKFLAALLGQDRGGKSFEVHCEKIARKYAKKADPTPDAAGVDRAVRYSRTLDAAPAFAGPADIDAFLAARAKNPSLSPEQWAEQKTGKS